MYDNIKKGKSSSRKICLFKFSLCEKSTPQKYAYNVYNENNEWCGCIVFSTGATPNIGKPFGLMQGEILELVRVALNGKQKCTSECVAAALKQLHQENPLIKIVVSYADEEQGHKGIIYQATNWIYLGKYVVDELVGYIIFGKKVHNRSIYSKGWKQNLQWLRENVDIKAEPWIGKCKHKYIYCFDKNERKKYLKMAKPYPKQNDN